VELDPEATLADLECLGGDAGSSPERTAPSRQLERVPMPLQRREGVLEAPRRAGARALGGQLHGSSPSSGLSMLRDPGAHCRGQQLHAEADAEKGPAASTDSRTSSFSALSQGCSASSSAPIGPPIASTASNSPPVGKRLVLVELDRARAPLPARASPREDARGLTGDVLEDQDPQRPRNHTPRRTNLFKSALTASTRRC
jgi:hypothetical protein